MRKTITSILFVSCAAAVTAQELTPLDPITEEENARPSVSIQAGPDSRNELSIRVAGFDLLLGKDDEHLDRFENRRHRPRSNYGGRIGTLELGFNGFDSWTKTDYSMYPADEHGFMDLNMGRSFHITVNIFTFSTSFTRNNVLGLTMGIGLTSNDFTFETPARYEKTDGMIHPIAPDHGLKKAKLHTLALHIPIAIEINPTRSFFISAGAYADLLLKSHLKSKFPKEKLHSPYTNFVQAGVTVRLGFENVYIFGNYALSALFREGKGPAITPYSLGLGFGF